ncbi:MAG TPA: low affinity iron permease family protein [Burkholderiales bacterium]|nr:low affinity iron permease family protein [Burkholderiales bacterium]
MRPTRSRTWFTRFAKWTAKAAGRPLAFTIAVAVIAAWVITGPLFGFSDTWQLIINTGTTIITFLMVFLIQSTQNRDSEAIQVKLDELIRLSKGGHNALLDLEELEEEELDAIREQYCRIAEEARAKLRQGEGDTDVPEVRQQLETAKREAREIAELKKHV